MDTDMGRGHVRRTSADEAIVVDHTEVNYRKRDRTPEFYERANPVGPPASKVFASRFFCEERGAVPEPDGL